MNATQRMVDDYGRVILDADSAFEVLYRGAIPNDLTCISSDDIGRYNTLCDEWDKPDEKISFPTPLTISPEEDQQKRIKDWMVPDAFVNLDVRAELLSRCSTDAERERVLLELEMFDERGLFPLLRLMFSLVDHWRANKIVLGCGRGSSVSSHVLFLIGVHRINAHKYGLDITEFLK